MIEKLQEKQINLKKGLTIHSPKYGWTRKIHKIKIAEEEVHMKNLDIKDERTYVFLIDNTLKNLKNGIFQIIEETKNG